jgi:hypothetical protein
MGKSYVLIAALLLVHPSASADEIWTRHTVDASSSGADGARLGDFNKDGLPDIVTPWEEGGAIRVAFNPGPALAKEPWPSVEVGRVGNPEDAMAMDVDGDGNIDVVSACEGKTRAVYIHWAPNDVTDSAAWKTDVIPASEGLQQFMYSVPADINRDGRMDIVSGGKNDDAALGWFECPENPREMSAWTWHPMTSVGWVMSLRVIEDETLLAPRILMSDRRGARRGIYHVVAGDDTRAPWTRVLLGGADDEAMFLDRNKTILVWATRNRGLMIRDSISGRVYGIHLPETAGTGKAVAIGDLDNDGDDDLVVSCEASGKLHGLFAYIQRDDGGWRFKDIAGPVGTKFDRIELLDLNGDGDLDILTCEEKENLGVIWYENPNEE